MPTLFDLLFVALFAVALPVIDHFFFWPAYRRRSQADPAGARRWLSVTTSRDLWLLVGLGTALWLLKGRSWASFGFTTPEGPRLWIAGAVILLLAAYHVLAMATLARSADARAKLRPQLAALTTFMPHTRTDMVWFAGVAGSAGFCEEFLYRGYFIWVFSPWLGWWGAAALSLLLFAVPHFHVYQSWNGVLRTGIIGAGFTLVVAIFDSLWPAITLHVLIDLGAGIMAWLVLRERYDRDVTDPSPLLT